MRLPTLILPLLLLPVFLHAQNGGSLSPGSHQKRIALVIGIGAYQNAGRLPNTVNDMKAMATALGDLGFDVIQVQDPTMNQLEEKVRQFADQIEIEKYPVAMCFYSGHGLQVDGKNYLVPVDAKLERQWEVKYQCLDAERILEYMESAKATTKIMLLDACRDNPLPKAWAKSGQNGGLAGMNTPAGTFIGYATAAYTTASAGSGQYSPYTAALLKHIKTPGLDIYSLFTRVAKETQENAAREGKVQTPYFNTSLTDVFYFANRFDQTIDPAIYDGDHDGLVDAEDECPLEYGTVKGCPDTDKDDIPDHVDRCPFEAGPTTNLGCPIIDRDNDGVADVSDQCPDVYGQKNWQGCPDTDGDLIPDHIDLCPGEAGLAASKGCPTEVYKEKGYRGELVEYNIGVQYARWQTPEESPWYSSFQGLGIKFLYVKRFGFSVISSFVMYSDESYFPEERYKDFKLQAGFAWKALSKPSGFRMIFVPNASLQFNLGSPQFGLQTLLNYKSGGLTLGWLSDFKGATGFEIGLQGCLFSKK